MNKFSRALRARLGYTAVELMVVTVIAAVLAATVGATLVKLLGIRERDREEGYVREKLADVCAAYADMMSIGTTFNTSTDALNQAVSVEYRHETGGVSLETGVVARVAYLSSMVNADSETLDFDVYVFEPGGLQQKLTRRADGDAALIPLPGAMVNCTITPLNYSEASVSNGYLKTDAALGWLEVKARYEVENDEGRLEEKTVSAGRVVRLWNRE